MLQFKAFSSKYSVTPLQFRGVLNAKERKRTQKNAVRSLGLSLYFRVLEGEFWPFAQIWPFPEKLSGGQPKSGVFALRVGRPPIYLYYYLNTFIVLLAFFCAIGGHALDL